MSYSVIFDQAMYLGFIGNYKMYVIRRIHIKVVIMLSTGSLLAMLIIQQMNLVNVFHGTMLQQTHGHRIQKNYRQFNARKENIKRNITGIGRQRLYGPGKELTYPAWGYVPIDKKKITSITFLGKNNCTLVLFV